MITLLSANAWIKLRINQKVIHIDPGFIGAYKTYGQPKEVFEEPADLVLISHEHSDHLQPSILKKIIKPDTLVVAPMVCDWGSARAQSVPLGSLPALAFRS